MARYGKPRSEPMYFTTLQICEALNVEATWLRVLEKSFKDIKPIINGSGKRRYRKLDFERIVWIYTQVESGLSLKEINLDLHQIPSTEYKTTIEKPVVKKKSISKKPKDVVPRGMKVLKSNLPSLQGQVKKRAQLVRKAKVFLEEIRNKITL